MRWDQCAETNSPGGISSPMLRIVKLSSTLGVNRLPRVKGAAISSRSPLRSAAKVHKVRVTDPGEVVDLVGGGTVKLRSKASSAGPTVQGWFHKRGSGHNCQPGYLVGV